MHSPHTVIYIGRDRGFNLSGVPLGGENYFGQTVGKLGQNKGSHCKYLQTKKRSGKACFSSTVHSGQNPTSTGSSFNTSVKRLCQTT